MVWWTFFPKFSYPSLCEFGRIFPIFNQQLSLTFAPRYVHHIRQSRLADQKNACISIQELQPSNDAALQSESVAETKSQTNPARPLQTKQCSLGGHKTNGAFRHSLTTPKVEWKLIKQSCQKVHLVAVLECITQSSADSYPIVDIHISIPVLSAQK